MPSRYSDRGRALAKAIRQQPALGRAALEFTEPYGTISALRDIKERPTDPWPYIFAMPVIGDAARFAKGKKLAELIRKNKKATGEPMRDWLSTPFMEQVKKRDWLEKFNSREISKVAKRRRKMIDEVQANDPELAKLLEKEIKDFELDQAMRKGQLEADLKDAGFTKLAKKRLDDPEQL